MWLAAKPPHQVIRASLEKLSTDLIEEADAVETIQAIPPALLGLTPE